MDWVILHGSLNDMEWMIGKSAFGVMDGCCLMELAYGICGKFHQSILTGVWIGYCAASPEYHSLQ